MLRRMIHQAAFILVAVPLWAGAAAPLHHHLAVTLDPPTGGLEATDRITLPEGAATALEFTLHAGLAPRVEGMGSLTALGTGEEAVSIERYRLEWPAGQRAITLRYGGVIRHPVASMGEGVGHEMATTPGLIGADGVFLSDASAWYPRIGGTPLDFDLDVTLPAGWEAISQGGRDASRPGHVRWRERAPQEEIWLVAGPLTFYQQPGRPAAMVFLRTPDPKLAQGYLAATDRYLGLYSRELGPYAYPKFALVENFWESGYGMPSFTLLGPRVIRLPFLLESSYPHEILHNWWGNGVFVDGRGGNWSEGLTAYLADHLIKEQAGHGAEYRRDQLQAYDSYVSSARDFPLSQFRERHSGATQAVGYGKGMMFFHMLRRELGDAKFTAGLRRFYRHRRFTDAGYPELRADFEAASGADLRPFFRQWVERAGAPALNLRDAQFVPGGVKVELEQTQEEAPFALRVPVIVGLADGREMEQTLQMRDRRLAATLRVTGEPVCVAVDPRFDLFRRLLPGEQPLSLGKIFGAGKLLILLPAGAPAPLRDAYARLASGWAAGDPGVDVRNDSDVAALPQDRAVLLLGWENRHRAALARARDPDGLMLELQRWPREGHSFVLADGAGGRALAWLATDDPAAVAPLARKVPHYGKYGYLVFAGPEAENKLKGEWPVDDSPLMQRTKDAAPCRGGSEIPLFR